MKASLWALVFSVLLGASAKAQQPATAVATNALATNNPSKFAEIRAKAEKGDAAAQTELGLMYVKGNGVPKDSAEAVKWFRKAAEQGAPYAQFNLGASYYYGDGVQQDYAEAVKWFRKATQHDESAAQFNLGMCYYQGQGVPQDYTEAVKWFRKAAEQGEASAQYNLGFCYDHSQGVPQDYAEAMKWFRRAAEQGAAYAQYNLGVDYYRGLSAPKDYAEAVKWFRRAAEQGYADAQYWLGITYELGRGVPQDYVAAYKWYNLAAAQNEPRASNNRDNISDSMTPSQIEEGQRLAREFKPRKAAELSPSTSDVAPADAGPTSSGTGFFITEDGLLLTAAHVVNGASQIRLVTRTGLLTARLVKLDAADDLALLEVEGQFLALPVVSSRSVKLGNTVATIGFPNGGLQGFAPKLAKGE